MVPVHSKILSSHKGVLGFYNTRNYHHYFIESVCAWNPYHIFTSLSHLMFVCYTLLCRLSSCSVGILPFSSFILKMSSMIEKMLRIRGLGWTLWNNVFSTWYNCYIRKSTTAVFIWIRPAQDQNSSIGEGLLRSYLRWGANRRLWQPWEWDSFFWTLLIA